EARKAAPKVAPKAAERGDFAGDPQVLEFAAHSSFMQGREEAHLDRHVIVKDLLAAGKALKTPLQLEKPVALFAVYGGHFGPKCSEFAAQNFHKKLLPRLAKLSGTARSLAESLCEALSASVEDVDAEFLQKFRTDRSGCCCCVALLVGTGLFVARLGLPALLCGAGSLDFLAPADLDAEAPRIAAAKGQLLEVAPGVRHVASADFEQRLKEFRVQQASGLGCSAAAPCSSPFSRALGDRDLKPVVSASAQVEVMWLQSSHSALALYCDGIAEAMSCEEVAAALRGASGAEKRAPAQLTQEAYTRGSAQNLTAIIVYFRWPAPKTQPAPTPKPQPPQPTQQPPKPEPAAPKPAPQPERKRPMSACELRDLKAARRGSRREEESRTDDATLSDLITPSSSCLQADPQLLLLSAGPLLVDEDGDLAHAFLAEDASRGLAPAEGFAPAWPPSGERPEMARRLVAKGSKQMFFL
ncbi:unnamed protein product, partial [Effrenium voratum]